MPAPAPQPPAGDAGMQGAEKQLLHIKIAGWLGIAATAGAVFLPYASTQRLGSFTLFSSGDGDGTTILLLCLLGIVFISVGLFIAAFATALISAGALILNIMRLNNMMELGYVQAVSFEAAVFIIPVASLLTMGSTLWAFVLMRQMKKTT